jgi:hypothetical protein
LLTSCANIKVLTRVMSACQASTCRSNISLTCVSKFSGMPVGAGGSSGPLEVWRAASSMRRSISRTSVK